MTKPISDKAEVALEYPDKFYSGTFERSSRFEASLDATGVLLVLERLGSEDVRKSVHIHINYGLLRHIAGIEFASVEDPGGRNPSRSTSTCGFCAQSRLASRSEKIEAEGALCLH